MFVFTNCEYKSIAAFMKNKKEAAVSFKFAALSRPLNVMKFFGRTNVLSVCKTSHINVYFLCTCGCNVVFCALWVKGVVR